MRSLLIDIAQFRRHSGMAATTFGRQAANDPRLVFDIRRGRECGSRLRERIYDFMADYECRSRQAECGKPGR